MIAIEFSGDLAAMDTAIEALPNRPAVFLLWPTEGEPFLSRTGLLRRRLLRLLKERERPSRLLNLRYTVSRIAYSLTGSAFASSVVFYEEARKHFPDRYLQLMKLRMPPYLKVILANEFPRSHITGHLTRAGGVYFGPFRSRASAEALKVSFSTCSRCAAAGRPGAHSRAPRLYLREMAMCLARASRWWARGIWP